MAANAEAIARLSDRVLLERLEPPVGKVSMVLDTDTYNEIDDQFAVAYALLSPRQMTVEAIYAAPFLNSRSTSAGDGMQKSYEEILRVLARLGRQSDGFVFQGSPRFLEAAGKPVDSPAARDLVKKAMSPREGLLYVVAIGAPTNVASAILLEPRIVERIVLVWLGGQPHDWHDSREFNFQQDLHATRVLFDSRVPFVQVPCALVAEQLRTTVPESEQFLKGSSPIGDYLHQILCEHHHDHFAWSKVIWDISAIAWLINPQWFQTRIVHAPLVTELCTYSHDNRRHLMRVATWLYRDGIFRDLFEKVRAAGVSAR